jgi:hypothetical protein
MMIVARDSGAPSEFAAAISPIDQVIVQPESS